jgi:hypothetical protein
MMSLAIFLSLLFFYSLISRSWFFLTSLFGKQGRLLNLGVFFLFGLIVVRASPQFNLALALYAVLSLTIVRMLPVAIALIGPA